jgi:hypothetical protein
MKRHPRAHAGAACLLFGLLLLAVLSLAFPAPPEAARTSGRQELSLNGTWDAAVTADPAHPPRGAKWETREVPFLAESNAIAGTRWVWYRKEITVPESFRGMKIDLLLCGARFNAAVFCNGNQVAARLEGYTLWSVDLTDRVKPGATFRLEIRCQDWSAVFKDNYRLPPDATTDGERLRGVPRGKLIAPIGGHFERFGLWDDVALLARPKTHYEDVAIDTSIRKNNALTVTGAVAGGGPGLWIEGEVRDKDAVALSLPGRVIGPGGRFALSAPFPTVRYWSPEDPHRYVLVLFLKDKQDGLVIDQYEERFGFRELWAEGPDFYLNGVKRHLLASSGWPAPRYQTADEIRKAILDIRESNAVAFRLHTQPWQRRWLEEADDLGLMLVEEGALWCDGGGGYAYDDDRFWRNVDTHLAGVVRRDRNHPSLVMWSIENELLHCGASNKCSCAEDRLAAAGRAVKALDPTHLITYEADHDPGGAADVIGLHYPREMPEHTDYPDTADWLGTTVTTGTAGGAAGSWNKDFFWERKKPLYIGEYLWVFQQDYSPGSVFYGDEAYVDKEECRVKAKADAWVFQTLAYRRAGVSGMCPWTIANEGGRVDKESPLFAAQKRAYEPVAIFPREYDTRFFAGEKVARSFDVFNDGAKPLALEVRASLTGWAAGYAERFTLEPAGHRVVTMRVPTPVKSAPDGLAFSASLYADGRNIHSFQTRYRVFDKATPALPPGRTLLVYDPAAGWPAGRRIPGAVALKKLDELAKYVPEKSILVIGPNAVAEKKAAGDLPVIGRKNTDAASFRRFLDKDGRALVLEQETLATLMPELELVDHASTMAFPASRTHPLLAGLGPDDLKFWRAGHYVSRREIRRPERFGARAIAVSGGADVLDQAPIVELPVGRGLAVFCQALAGSKYETEPAARRLVANAVSYLAAYRPAPGRALVIAEGAEAAEFTRRLADLGLAYAEAHDKPRKADLDKTDLLILHGGGEKIDALAPLLAGCARPLTVYWHAPDAGSYDKLKSALGLGNTAVRPQPGPITLLGADEPAMRDVLREDITFLKPFGPDNWYRVIDPDPSVVDRALDTAGGDTAADRYAIENWTLSGALVQPAPDMSVGFYTNGAAAGEIAIPKAGLYRLVLEAKGTPAEGGWPLVVLKDDGKIAGQFSVTSPDWGNWPCLARLPQGKVRVELAFVNDLYEKGEDRNVFIRALAVGRAPFALGGVTLLSLPPALAAARTKAGGRAVVDCVRWDTNRDNRVRGLRYASTLLANLGAAFDSGRPTPDWIEAQAFQPAGEISVFSRTDTQLNFGSNGAVKAAFSCAMAGEYAVVVRGYATPAKGEYGKARVRVDGKVVGEAELVSPTAAQFPVGRVRLAAGTHELEVEFINDLWLGPGKEDRNLFVNAVGFTAAD